MCVSVPVPVCVCACTPVTYPQGIVFFAGSSNNSDSNGVLLALNAANGSIIWRLNATDPVVGSYGMRFVPAIDPQYVCVPVCVLGVCVCGVCVLGVSGTSLIFESGAAILTECL